LLEHSIDLDMQMLKAIAPLHNIKIITTFETLAISLGTKIISPTFFDHHLKYAKDWIKHHNL
jgi:hypothetical protein